MRVPVSRWLAAVVAVGASACPAVDVSLPTPLDRFYFPSAIAHLDNPSGPDGGHGLLVVASTNFDKRFSGGSLIALNLDALPVPLPPFGATPGSPVTQLPSLRSAALQVDGGAPDAVLIAPFAGQLAALSLGAERWRLFVPTRSERQRVHAVELTVGAGGALSLACFNSPTRDCSATATSLTAFEQTETALPRAPGAFGVGLRPRACTSPEDCGVGQFACRQSRCVATPEGKPEEPAVDVLVTHITQADTPLGSGKEQRGYLVKLQSESMQLTPEHFVNLGPGASHAVAVGARWSYVSGRFLNPLANLVRLVDPSKGTVISSGLESVFRVSDSRGIALSSDERRVYLLGRSPDALMVASVEEPLGDQPRLQIVRGNPLPEGPSELAVLSRPGRSDLVAITCTGAGVLALYDDDVGDVVAQVPGVGVQPFGLAVDRRGSGARVYTTNFQDGRVAVIDIPDLEQPQSARLVAHLGRQQLCLIRASDPSCATDAGVP